MINVLTNTQYLAARQYASEYDFKPHEWCILYILCIVWLYHMITV